MRFFFGPILICLFSNLIKAQDGVTSSGGDANGSGGSVAFSIGQLVYTEQINSNGSLHQGVEIAYESNNLDGSGIKPSGCLCVYPNPTEKNLTLEVPAYVDQNYSYKLYSTLGVELTNGHVNALRTPLFTEIFPGSLYILQVYKHDELIETFKILKK